MWTYQEFGNPSQFFRQSLAWIHLILDPVALLLESHLLHIVHIVRVVVETVDLGFLVKTLNQHSLPSQCVICKRTVDFCHPLSLSPLPDSINKCLGDGRIFLKIKPSEPDSLKAVIIVVSRIDYALNPSNNFSFVVIGQEKLSLAVKKGRIILQRVLLVRVQGRNVIPALTVQAVLEFIELPELFSRSNFLDCNRHNRANLQSLQI